MYIFEQYADSISPINIDTYKPNPHRYVLFLLTEIVVDYIQRERKVCQKYGMGKLELEYRCPKYFLEIEDDTLAREWIAGNTQLTDKGLILYVIQNSSEMKIGRHKFLVYALKTFFNCRF